MTVKEWGLVEGGHVRSRDQVRGREYVGFYKPGTILYFIRTYFYMTGCLLEFKVC